MTPSLPQAMEQGASWRSLNPVTFVPYQAKRPEIPSVASITSPHDLGVVSATGQRCLSC